MDSKKVIQQLESPVNPDLRETGENNFDHLTKTDLIMIRKAFRDRWPIPEETRQQIMDKLIEMAINSEDERAKVSALKTIVEADKLNLAYLRYEEDRPKKVQVDVTSGGVPLRIDPKRLSDEELRIALEQHGVNPETLELN